MKLLTILCILCTFNAFAQTGDASIDADAAKIKNSYISKDTLTKGAVGKSSNMFDGVVDSLSTTVDSIKEASAPAIDSVAPMINNVSDALGIDARIKTENEKKAMMAPPPKPKDALDIALEEIGRKSAIALDMNKTLPAVSDEMSAAVIEALPDSLLVLKEKSTKTVNKQANTFVIESNYSDNVNSFTISIKRDLNFSVINTVFFNHLFFSPTSPLGLKGLAGEEYYSKDCREGPINGIVAMVCYNSGLLKTYVALPISPSVFFGITVGGKDSMKIAREYVFALDSAKIKQIVKDTADSNLVYAEEINKKYFAEKKLESEKNQTMSLEQPVKTEGK